MDWMEALLKIEVFGLVVPTKNTNLKVWKCLEDGWLKANTNMIVCDFASVIATELCKFVP